MPNDLENYHLRIDPAAALQSASEKLGCTIAARCGGCPEFDRTPSIQREHKTAALRSGLLAHGVACPDGVPWLTGRTRAYRNRIRLAVREGLPSYFNGDKDPSCAVLEPQVVSVVAAFERWAPRHRGALANYCVAEVRTFDADGVAAIYLRHTQRNGLAIAPPDWTLLPEQVDGVVLAVEGGPVRSQRFLVTDHVYAKIPVGGFMQVNSGANRLMVQQVVAWANRVKARRVLDLYAGSGNFTLPLAWTGAEVLAVEFDASACLALEVAAREQSMEQVAVSVGDALTRASQLAGNGETYDMVIADPPRGGLRGEVDALSTMAKTAVVLVSCEMGRFCNDARALRDRGWELAECVAVDMFPHTRHVEVLGLFTRR